MISGSKTDAQEIYSNIIQHYYCTRFCEICQGDFQKKPFNCQILVLFSTHVAVERTSALVRHTNFMAKFTAPPPSRKSIPCNATKLPSREKFYLQSAAGCCIIVLLYAGHGRLSVRCGGRFPPSPGLVRNSKDLLENWRSARFRSIFCG